MSLNDNENWNTASNIQNSMEHVRSYAPGSRTVEELLRDELAALIRFAGNYSERARSARLMADMHDADAKSHEPRIAELQEALRTLGATV